MNATLQSSRRLPPVACLHGLAIAVMWAAAVNVASAQPAHVVKFEIPPIAYASSTQHPAALAITEADIAMGYVDVVDRTSLMINANVEQVVMQVRIDAPMIARADLRVAGRDYNVASHNGTLLLATRRGENQPVAIAYRFHLNPGARAGLYAWPLTLNVTPKVA
jgi:hypothetical protein